MNQPVTTKEALEPCPFCLHGVGFIRNESGRYNGVVWVECDWPSHAVRLTAGPDAAPPCGARTAEYQTELEAITAWNSRVSTASVAPAVDAMWEALKAACCKNPAEAKLAVFVSEKKFKDALAPFAAPIVAPVVDDADDLHLAICQAVHLMNQGDLHAGHDLLRQTLIDYADKKAPLSRTEIVRQQQRSGSSATTAIMVSSEAPYCNRCQAYHSVSQPCFDIATAIKCSECGAENGWHRTTCSRHPRFTAPASPAALRDEAEQAK